MTRQPAPRRGVGDPPAGCTCILAQHVVNRVGPDFGKTAWSIHVADPTCPAHYPEGTHDRQ